MKKLIYFQQFSQNEEINWKKIRTLGGTISDYTMWSALALTLGLKLTPKDIQKYPTRYYMASKVEKLDDYEFTDILNKAKNSVIEKVKRQENIINKKELIDRINNVIVKQHDKDEKAHIFEPKSDIMHYFLFSDKDYIVVSSGTTKAEYNTFVHELNHLVDKRKVVKEEILPSTFINKDMTDKEFWEFQYYYYPRFKENQIVDGDTITDEDMAYYIYEWVEDNKDYLLSDAEVYARLSHLRTHLIDEGYMSPNQEITKEVVFEFCKDVNKMRLTFDEHMDLMDKLDFYPILPYIQWEKIDKIQKLTSLDSKELNLA